ncbi:hypothetical protein ACFXOS_01470 [Streptomyces sp. NPDC059175]|uniref:HoxN/HupN/NixA family nickel/cobalt transporter n=1 Tax=Streptomyces sp. NPDC059175 TaxID=3346757 RepID=UPI003690BB34
MAALGIAIVALVAGATSASAHPLGNFTINRYDGLVVGEDALRVDHVEDLAEIPTARIRPESMPPGGLVAWARARCASAADEARLLVDGRTVPLTPGTSRAETRPGQAGLPTLRVECAMTAPLPQGRVRIDFRAGGAEGAGWREVTARGDRTTLTSSDVPEDSASRRLSTYPEGLLESPPDRTTAALEVEPGGPALSGEPVREAPASALPRGVDRWTQMLTGLVERRDLTLPFAVMALGIALVLGAFHALAPGHGKTLMAAAAAAGGRSSLREVLTLGASVTVTHTLGVFVLGGVIAAGSAVTPSIVGWLSVASGILVTATGALLVRRAWHNRAHQHGHSHVHWFGQGHHHHHDHHDGDHEHGQGRATDGTAQEHPHPHPHGHDHGHSPARGKPAASPTGGTHPLRRSVLLGFAGGMVPSPSAVVVLVGAAALGHAWFGFLLVVAYGAGLALTLTAAGFAVVRVGERVAARLARRRTTGRLTGLVYRLAPLSTAMAVFVLGCGLVLKGAAGALS